MNEEQKREICKAYAFGYDIAAISEIEGVPEADVKEIIEKNPEIIEEIKSRGDE